MRGVRWRSGCTFRALELLSVTLGLHVRPAECCRSGTQICRRVMWCPPFLTGDLESLQHTNGPQHGRHGPIQQAQSQAVLVWKSEQGCCVGRTVRNGGGGVLNDNLRGARCVVGKTVLQQNLEDRPWAQRAGRGPCGSLAAPPMAERWAIQVGPR